MNMDGEVEFYAAPRACEFDLPTEDLVNELLLERGRLPELLFALGNIQLRDRRYEQALEVFTEALQHEGGEQGKIRVNRAVVLHALGRVEEAIAELRQVALSVPELELAHVLLSRLLAQSGNKEAAIQSLERALRINPHSSPALLLVGILLEESGDSVRAEVMYEQAVAADKASEAAALRLGRLHFYRAKALFIAGAVEGAFRLWGDIYRRAGGTFHRLPDVTREYRSLIVQFEREGGLAAALREYELRFADDAKERAAIYPLILRFLFSVGLLPECFEERGALAKAKERWLGELGRFGEHPYPHFRLGVVASLEGDFSRAREEFRWCQDKLPPKKQESLRLAQLLGFFTAVEEVEHAVEANRQSGAPLDAWERAGFADPFQQRAWKESGLDPDVAAVWREAGLPPTHAARWNRAGIAPSVAIGWRENGFTEPNDARRWIRGGFDPAQAAAWREHFPLPIDEAIQWRCSGFDDPQLACEWSRVFPFPWAALPWRELGFRPFEALSWSESGFKDPFAADAWRKKGKTPGEALRQFTEIGEDVVELHGPEEEEYGLLGLPHASRKDS